MELRRATFTASVQPALPSGDSIVAMGNTVEHFRADYTWTNALTPAVELEVNADAQETNGSRILAR
jgi:hypothetical protein